MRDMKRFLNVAGLVVCLVVSCAVLSWAQGGGDQPSTATMGKTAQAPDAGLEARIQGAIKNLKYLHGAGGPTMYFIDIALVIGVAFVLERLARMRRKKILPSKLLNQANELLENDQIEGVKELCAKGKKSTLAKVLDYLVGEGQDVGRQEREATVNEIASRDIDVHRMMCFPLAAIAGLSPLMGLLGTVSGIRECFRDVALAGEMGNPAMLAGGIEKALITTIYGLVVAIVTLFGYNLFKFRINLIANELEEVISSVVGRHFKTEIVAK